MKQALLALVSVVLLTCGLGSVASARSVDRTPVVATLTGSENGIHMIALLADGRLQVQKADGKVVQVKLTVLAAEEMLSSAKYLANVTVTESTDARIRCTGMPRPSLSRLSMAAYDEDKDKFEGTPRLILSSQHCSLRIKVLPEHDYNVLAAKEFRAQLVILAYSMIK